MNKQSKKLTTADLCAAHGVTARTVRNWLALGCPTAGRKRDRKQGGRPRWLFDADAVKSWLCAQGRFTPGMEGAVLKGAFADMPLDMDMEGLLAGMDMDLPALDLELVESFAKGEL